MRLKVSSGKWRPFCLDLNVLMALMSGKIDSSQIDLWVVPVNCGGHIDGRNRDLTGGLPDMAEICNESLYKLQYKVKELLRKL